LIAIVVVRRAATAIENFWHLAWHSHMLQVTLHGARRPVATAVICTPIYCMTGRCRRPVHHIQTGRLQGGEIKK